MSDIQVIRKGFKCLRCGYEWVPKISGNKPKLCAKCRSYLWDRPRVRLPRRKGQPSIKELARQLNPRRQIVHEELKEIRAGEDIINEVGGKEKLQKGKGKGKERRRGTKKS